MIRLLKSRLESASRGQAAVETALVLTIVILLALGTLDLGRGIAAHIALQEATQEGAMVAGYRYCDGPPDEMTDAALELLVRTSSSADAVTNADVTVPSVNTDYVTVRSEYPMPIITPLITFIFGPNITIGVEVTATNFHWPCV